MALSDNNKTSDEEQTDIYKRATRFFGSIGGTTTRDRYGKKHFSELGKKGMAKRWGKKKNDDPIKI